MEELVGRGITIGFFQVEKKILDSALGLVAFAKVKQFLELFSISILKVPH